MTSNRITCCGKFADSYKLSDLCRLCGNFYSEMKPIFNHDHECDYSVIINTHFPDFNVSESDQLPMQMCYHCASALESWHNFYVSCMNINKRFQIVLEKFQNSDSFLENTRILPIMYNIKNTAVDETDNVHIKDEESTSEYETQDTQNDKYDFEVIEIGIDDIHLFTFADCYNDISDELSSPCCSSNFNDNAESDENVDVKNVLGENKYNFVSVKTNDNSTNINEMNKNSLDISKEYEFSVNLTENYKPRKRKVKRNKPPPSVCYICGKIFSGPDTFKVHIRTIHSENRPYTCIECSQAFKRRDHLLCHQKFVHSSKKQKNNTSITKDVKCVHCDQIFPTRTDRRTHMELVHGKLKQFKCLECNTVFKKYSTYYGHRTRGHHNQVKTAFLKYCELCGLEFENETFYVRHKWKHEENLYCDLCSIKFENRDLLMEHVETKHSKIRDVQCDVCGKKFSGNSNLQNHLKIHSERKPYQCDHCSWRFLKKGHLLAHMYRHTGERPFVCSICNKGFKQKGDMRKHKMSHIKPNLVNLSSSK